LASGEKRKKKQGPDWYFRLDGGGGHAGGHLPRSNKKSYGPRKDLFIGKKGTIARRRRKGKKTNADNGGEKKLKTGGLTAEQGGRRPTTTSPIHQKVGI